MQIDHYHCLVNYCMDEILWNIEPKFNDIAKNLEILGYVSIVNKLRGVGKTLVVPLSTWSHLCLLPCQVSSDFESCNVHMRLRMSWLRELQHLKRFRGYRSQSFRNSPDFRQMGAIFVTKCSLTLQTDMLGTPEILWEHDRFDAQLGERD